MRNQECVIISLDKFDPINNYRFCQPKHTQTHRSTHLKVLICLKYVLVLRNPSRSQQSQPETPPTYSHILTYKMYSVIHNKKNKIMTTQHTAAKILAYSY